MSIEIVRKNVNPRAWIETCDISNAQVWSNHNGTTLMTVPHENDKDCYIILVLDYNGMITHWITMGTDALVGYLNRYLFEEINAKIELYS